MKLLPEFILLLGLTLGIKPLFAQSCLLRLLLIALGVAVAYTLILNH